MKQRGGAMRKPPAKGVDTVKYAIGVGVVLAGWICVVGAQERPQPVLKQGVSVELAVAGHAVEMRAADEQDATVVAITAEGKIYVGVTRAEPEALSGLSAETVYLKADARVPYQKLLTVLEALRGKSVVLLTATPSDAPRTNFMPPYGMRLTVSR
jgi:hypothetical protein